VRLWDATTGEGKLVVRGTQQEGGVYDVAFSPCGTRLATTHGNGEVKVWSVKDLLRQ
jgi:WD40 repeat protein